MRPTGRFYTFLLVAFLLYLAANQTQVNWLYVMAALLAGVVPAAWLLGRGALHGLSLARHLGDDAPRQTYHEGDEVAITLTARAQARTLAQLRLLETCPLAPPAGQQQRLFVPQLPRHTPLQHTYTVTLYKRGVYHFPPVAVRTRVPFGLFAQSRSHPVATDVLAYPEVRALPRLDLLDRQPAAQVTSRAAGLGSEVLGVRGYQPGDSPRHIHWRSVARTGRLVSKEFAEETQPGVSIVLDRNMGEGWDAKHNPFEWGVKAGVAVAAYAQARGYPVHVHADPTDLPPPVGALQWDTLMQYTARLAPRPGSRLEDVLLAGGFRQFVAVMVAVPSPALLAPLLAARTRAAGVLVALPDPATFPGGGQSASDLAGALRARGVPVVTLTYGEDWAAQLAAGGGATRPTKGVAQF